jgi:cysteinyl-tRNA synthetase
MKLYNTLTRSIEPFTPLQDTVRIYSCGPTVYDHAHIGNLSAYIFADTLRRTLHITGNTMQHAMNYTDVDDKTIRRSRERYPDMEPREALRKLTDTYIDVFLDDMRTIGNDIEAIQFIRATDDQTITGMQQLITALYDRGFAYVADDGVYFSIEAYRNSGKTYGQLLEITTGNTSAARIQNDEYDKESVHDFALWKVQKDDEPAWPFTLDGKDLTGRPGWHIECSVMSQQALGQPFDIHTGGVDLIFPHHENEIAQSTALEDNPVMAQFFCHNEHILVDGKKMSKSANNFYTLDDITKKGYELLAFRMLVLQAHYRNQVNFTWESLEAAQNRLKRWRSTADLRWQVLQPSHFIDNVPADKAALESLAAAHPHTTRSAALVEQAALALQQDIDTPAALNAIDQLMQLVENEGMTPFVQPNFVQLMQFAQQALGIDLFSEDITSEQKALIAEREQVREAQDWAQSDTLRNQLKQQGIGVRDTARGTTWYHL